MPRFTGTCVIVFGAWLAFGSAATAQERPLQVLERLVEGAAASIARAARSASPAGAARTVARPMVDPPLPHLRPEMADQPPGDGFAPARAGGADETARTGQSAAIGVPLPPIAPLPPAEPAEPRVAAPGAPLSAPASRDAAMEAQARPGAAPAARPAVTEPIAAAALPDAAASPPLPTLRPSEPAAGEPIVAAIPEPTVEPPEPEFQPTANPAELAACIVALSTLGVSATHSLPVVDGQCGIDKPVAVSALEGGVLDLLPEATIDCDLAAALARWVGDAVQPTAEAMLNAHVTAIRVAGAYVCRPVDNIAGARLSEHAFGRAIDISGFRVGDRWIDVRQATGTADQAGDPGETVHDPGEAAEAQDVVDAAATASGDAAFLNAIRQAACGTFTTVLGPGTDAFHTDHFHLDLAMRNTAGPSRGLYCR
jgi:hypothetical protein